MFQFCYRKKEKFKIKCASKNCGEKYNDIIHFCSQEHFIKYMNENNEILIETNCKNCKKMFYFSTKKYKIGYIDNIECLHNFCSVYCFKYYQHARIRL